MRHNGVDIGALAEALGHQDPGFTLRIYTHLMPTAADKIRAAVDAVLRTALSQDHAPATAQEVS